LVDYILNGQGFGSVASILIATKFNPAALRPFIGEDGRSYIAVPKMGTDGKPVLNANGKPKMIGIPTVNASAALLRDEWKLIDTAVMRAAKPRMRAWGDLRAVNQLVIPNGMRKTMLEYQTMGDITPATISMDGLRRGEADRFELDLKHMPLPIIHKDFEYSARQIAVSRESNTPLDTTGAELASERVAEEVEKLSVGVASSYSFGGGSVYGYINLPERNTQVLTNPTVVTNPVWTGKKLVNEVLQMKQKSLDDRFYGPWILYTSPAWDIVLDDDYVENNGTSTLRARLKQIDGISDIRVLDYLTGFQMIMIQMTPTVARAVIGMDIVTLQWESHGGMQVNFKVMAIMVPQLRVGPAGTTGIVHGVAA
jgi:uncharacterized linocin/CFP29 family protein